MDFREVIRTRRMTRSFLASEVDSRIVQECVELASRSPSAGKTQGWNLLMLEGSDVARYWDIALPEARRTSFAFPGLLQAPILLLSLADRQAYLQRYSEPDKGGSQLGASIEAWPAPYWTIDASFATMTLLLALHERGLGSLFFAHAEEESLRATFNIPDHVEILGAIAVGYPDLSATRRGRSATRRRRSSNEIIHRQRW
ncbi:MAG: hypothetical protein RIR69_1736 [Actinomycetota bacterium]